MKAAVPQILVTCEHGGNAVPREYRRLFGGRQRLLDSHRGLDLGAAPAARWLSRTWRCPLVCAGVTRLLVDLNRSIGHPALFSPLTRPLSPAARQRILDLYYRPYRELVSAWLAATIADGHRVIHLSVHSFTPRLHGQTRKAEVGFLYDPARVREARFCRDWQARLDAAAPSLRVRLNYPYRGTADGFVAALRSRLPAARYVGIEIEINQARLVTRRGRLMLLRALAQTAALGHWPSP